MATAQPTRQKRPTDGFAGRDPQVYHPLDQLRGTIRRYVVIEGVLSAALFLTLWFTLGLALDYGVFKTLWWDWALDGSWWLRLLALVLAVGLFASILVVRIGRRVAKEFSYPALALVLERKFPKVLGDRLITAVEMADVEAMGKFGYSMDMIRATIAEARERVAKVPVHEVFNWRRLRRMAALTVGLAAGLLVVSYATYAYMARSADPVRFAWKFAHVTGTFVERNVALLNTPWPRDAYIELVGLPEGGEIAIGRDAPPPQLTVRAYRWVVADRAAPHGWRPMLWSDVTPRLVGRAVPDLPFGELRVAGETGEMPPDASAWTLDTVEARASELETEGAEVTVAVRERLRSRMGDEFDQLQEVFRALAERADEPGMARTFRRLGTTRNQFKFTERHPVTRELQFVFRFDRDAEILAEYQFSGNKTSGSGTLTRQRNNVYEGTVGGLKEDVEFIVRAADFDTTPRKIRIIPPPTLKRLIRDQAEPGYLHHAPPLNEGYNALESRLQKIASKDLSLTGDRSVVVVPAGTVLTLTAEAYTADDGSIPDADRIVTAHAIPVGGRFPGTVYDDKAKPTQTPVPLALAPDGAGFGVTFNETITLPRRVTGGPDFAGTAFASAVGALRKYTDFRLTENVEFKVVFVNKYNVSTTRTFVLQVVQDQAPVVEVAVDVIRKSGNFYLVTPKARIPFETNSFVKDDRGLSKVEYTFSYYAEDSDFVRGLRAKLALRSLLDVPLPGTMPSAFLSRLHAENFKLLDKSDDRLSSSVFVSEFSTQQGTLLRDNRADLGALLGTAKAEELTPQLVKSLDEKYPGRPPGSKAFWVGNPQAVKAFWIGEPYTAKAVWVVDASDPQTFNKLDLKNTERGAFRKELIDQKAMNEGDEIHWFGDPQTVKRIELKNPDRDYFDLKELHEKGLLAIAAKDTDVQTIFRMDLNVQATDNNVDNEGGPRGTKNAEPIRLRIVSEGDLLIEISREEEQLATRLDEALLKLAAAKRKYEFVRTTNGYKDETPEQVDAVKVRAQDAFGDVEKARDVVQAVAREYRRLTRECEINRVNETAQKRYAEFTAEIETILSDAPQVPVTFPKTQALMTNVQNALNGGRWAPLAAVSDAENSLYALERDLRTLRNKLGESQTLDGLKRSVAAIQERQRRIAADVEAQRRIWEIEVNSKDPKIGEAGAQSLTKGEAKKIQHAIQWRQYVGPKGKEDELQVKVTASDPSITVPPELTLNFERHEFRFEYEIKAGTKDGTFKITLMPAVGKPVEVQVIVK